MSTNSSHLQISNVEIDVIRKDIKNMHLAVYPPHGRIRLAVPMKTDEEVVRLFAINKLGWIKKHVKSFQEQARETKRDYVSGESLFFQGIRYILEVEEKEGYSSVKFEGTKKIKLKVKKGATTEEKAIVMREWYRKQLKIQVEPLIEKWEKIIGVSSNEWGVKQMKTKWGSCNTSSKKIWLNLELAKKPQVCLEYILVHELVHLHERNHNDRFVALMDKFMPKWRLFRDELNNLPIVHNDWGY
jgi:predicted metal-dependent hydrolase